jgi:transposase-like protein
MGQELIRYSEAFKLKVISELEAGRWSSAEQARHRYGIGGTTTIGNWLRKYGKRHLVGRIIRVETGQERDEARELRARIRQLEHALADAKVQETIYKGYFEISCEQSGIGDLEAFKKSIDRKLFGVESSGEKVHHQEKDRQSPAAPKG